MTYINMTRSNALRNIAGPSDFVAWGKESWNKQLNNVNVRGNINALVFAAVLIACSITVGCSKDKDQPKPMTINNQAPVIPAPASVAPMPAPVMKAESKPAPKKVVRKRPATVNYSDKTYGVAFEYPRRYAIETGEAATELLTTSPVPMNFVQPGGVALAAVELPETAYTNTDFSSAFFNVSVHKGLTADQCTEFAVPAPIASTQAVNMQKDETTPVASASSSETVKTEAESVQTASSETSATQTHDTPGQTTSTQPASTQDASSQTPASADVKPAETQATTTVAETSNTASPQAPDPKTEQKSDLKADNAATVAQSDVQASKPASELTLSDLKMHGTEAVSGEGTRQSDSKYFHVYQNGSCYEFGMNVTTNASGDGVTRHVDRDRVFANLEKILATVKFDEVKPSAGTPETANAPKLPATSEGHTE
jgi:hypothetical protein